MKREFPSHTGQSFIYQEGSCREYFLAEDTLQYTLGFGTNNKDGMFDLYDRMARSFEFSAE